MVFLFMLNQRDIEILRKICGYCAKLDLLKNRFGDDFSMFVDDEDYQAAAGMYIQQIGEMAKRLSNEFAEEYNEIPWREIKAMRNIYAHEYDSIAPQIVWDTIIYDCPELNKYCSKILEE